MKSNIALIGFMGSGKSTAGKRLARRLNRDFIETDRLIETRASGAKPPSATWKKKSLKKLLLPIKTPSYPAGAGWS